MGNTTELDLAEYVVAATRAMLEKATHLRLEAGQLEQHAKTLIAQHTGIDFDKEDWNLDLAAGKVVRAHDGTGTTDGHDSPTA